MNDLYAVVDGEIQNQKDKKKNQKHNNYEFIYLSYTKNVLFIPLFSFNAEAIGFEFTSVSVFTCILFIILKL